MQSTKMTTTLLLALIQCTVATTATFPPEPNRGWSHAQYLEVAQPDVLAITKNYIEKPWTALPSHGPAREWQGPAGDVVALALGGHQGPQQVVGLDAKTGAMRWRTPELPIKQVEVNGLRTLVALTAAGSDLIGVYQNAKYKGDVFLVSRNSGKVLWHAEIPGLPCRRIVESGDSILLATRTLGGGPLAVVALSRASGEILGQWGEGAAPDAVPFTTRFPNLAGRWISFGSVVWKDTAFARFTGLDPMDPYDIRVMPDGLLVQFRMYETEFAWAGSYGLGYLVPSGRGPDYVWTDRWKGRLHRPRDEGTLNNLSGLGAPHLGAGVAFWTFMNQGNSSGAEAFNLAGKSVRILPDLCPVATTTEGVLMTEKDQCYLWLDRRAVQVAPAGTPTQFGVLVTEENRSNGDEVVSMHPYEW